MIVVPFASSPSPGFGVYMLWRLPVYGYEFLMLARDISLSNAAKTINIGMMVADATEYLYLEDWMQNPGCPPAELAMARGSSLCMMTGQYRFTGVGAIAIASRIDTNVAEGNLSVAEGIQLFYRDVEILSVPLQCNDGRGLSFPPLVANAGMRPRQRRRQAESAHGPAYHGAGATNPTTGEPWPI